MPVPEIEHADTGKVREQLQLLVLLVLGLVEGHVSAYPARNMEDPTQYVWVVVSAPEVLSAGKG